jgi:8-oxo-dGTP diphosphatase
MSGRRESPHARTSPLGSEPSVDHDEVVAAGAVVWRGNPDSPDVALVHRPAYDDWSFPKGKVDAGEHVIVAAVREIAEELGSSVELGVPLPTARYVVAGVPKTVHYWAARHVGGAFTPDDEVDEVEWLTLADARQQLTHGADRGLLDAFAEAPLNTHPAIALRHAKAKPRSTWAGDDAARPLTGRGRAQADVLSVLLHRAYGTLRVVTSPWLRCVQTVEPYAAASLGTVEFLDALGEEEFEDDIDQARIEMGRLLSDGRGVLACSHGNVMPDLVRAFLGPSGGEGVEAGDLAKGEFVIAHRTGGRTLAVERHRV